MHEVESGWVELATAPGESFRAFAARPLGLDRAPGLLVFQEIFGVNAHIREVAEGWAREGFVALAPELFHRTAPGFDIPYSDYQPGKEEAAKMTEEGLHADLDAAAAWFQRHSQAGGAALGAIGYCMGGRIAFQANAHLPLACAVSYYGGMLQARTALVPRLRGPQLFVWAGRDEAITWEQRPVLIEAMKAAKKPFAEALFSEAQHGFNCDRSPGRHDAAVARQARALALAFLKEHLG